MSREPMATQRIRQSRRYGYDESAPVAIVIVNGDLKMARHVAHTVQEWAWPGEEGKFEVEGDHDEPVRCGCGAIL